MRLITFLRAFKSTLLRARFAWAVSFATAGGRDFELDLLQAFASELGSAVIHFVPRNNVVQRAEINKKTVIDFDPKEDQSMSIATAMAINQNKTLLSAFRWMQDRLALMMSYGILG